MSERYLGPLTALRESVDGFSLQALCGDQPLGHLSNGLGGVLQLLPLK